MSRPANPVGLVFVYLLFSPVFLTIGILWLSGWLVYATILLILLPFKLIGGDSHER